MGTWGNDAIEKRYWKLEVGPGGVGKSGVLEHKRGNISETRTRKDKRKIYYGGLWELTNALSNGTIPDPLQPRRPQD